MIDVIEQDRLFNQIQAFLKEHYPDALQFVGPKNWHCFGTKYEVIGVTGVAQPGEVQPLAASAEEAEALHFEQLRLFCEGASQIAWRRPTELRKLNGGWAITSRLAVFR